MTYIENFVDLYNQIKQNLDSMPDMKNGLPMEIVGDMPFQNKLPEQKEQSFIHASGAKGIAHDINNMLSVISGYLELIMEAPQSDKTEIYVEHCLKAAGMLRELNTLYLNATPEGSVFDTIMSIAEAVKQSLLMIVGIRPDIDYTISIAPGTKYFKINPLHLRRIVQNLAKNAIEAMPQGGMLSVSFENETRDYDNGLQRKALPFVKMIFKDNGHGIDTIKLKHIFDSGYTTKQSGNGLGLGITQYLVQHNNGYIEASSTEGAGTVLTLHFPAISPPRLKFLP